MRGASLLGLLGLLGLLVVLAFCAFSLRPRQTPFLGAFAMLAMGTSMAWLVYRYPLRYPVHVELMHFLLARGAVVAVTLLNGELSKLRARLKQQKADLVKALATIHTLATVDELTLLANRRHMHQVAPSDQRRRAAPDHVRPAPLHGAARH